MHPSTLSKRRCRCSTPKHNKQTKKHTKIGTIGYNGRLLIFNPIFCSAYAGCVFLTTYWVLQHCFGPNIFQWARNAANIKYVSTGMVNTKHGNVEMSTSRSHVIASKNKGMELSSKNKDRVKLKDVLKNRDLFDAFMGFLLKGLPYRIYSVSPLFSHSPFNPPQNSAARTFWHW